jgi:hypothetical protein
MYKKLLHIVSWLGIVLLLAFQQQLYYTWHYHRLPNGELIKHYHPYNHKQPYSKNNQHGHHSKELIYLSFIDGYFNTSPGQDIDKSRLQQSELLFICVELKPFYDKGLYRVNFFRGPPIS